jgi:hypothetical protein
MPRFNALALVLAGMLAGCAASGPQIVRTDDTESILIEFVETGGTDVRGRVHWLYDDYDCYGRNPQSGFVVGGTPVRNAVGTTGKRFFTVHADYTGTAAPASCNIVYTFPIEPGGRYRVAMSSSAQGCQTQLTQMTLASSGAGEVAGPPLTETRKREMVTDAPPDQDGPWCKPNAPYAGSSRLIKPRGGP